ncbi:MAG: PaaI family thioesterase [Planctomycetes bacterium]|nr:PaaI family thioesterase [Planctomycetota bacterium]
MTELEPLTSDDSGQASPFLRELGVVLAERQVGSVRLELIVAEPHLRTRGIAHGGVIASLLDTAMGVAVSTKVPDGCFPVTAQLNVNFIRPAWDGEKLQIEGKVRHSGRTTAVAQGEIRTDSGVLVATSSGTFSFVPDPDPDSETLTRKEDASEQN